MPTCQCNGADLYYEDAGDGQPIVFLHGAWAGLRYFQPQLAGLSDRYRTIALDFRGHGRSEKTDAGHTIPQYARDVHAFLDGMGIDDVVLVGWSLGALVTWEYVDRYGTDSVRALADVDMEPSPSDWEDGSEGRYDADQVRDIHVAVQDDHWQFVEDTEDALLKNAPSPELHRTMFDEETRCPPTIKSAIILDAAMRGYADVLPTIDVPSLVCAGADEKWRSVAAVRGAYDLLPNARFEVFEDSGHVLTLEEPDVFNRILADFVSSL